MRLSFFLSRDRCCKYDVLSPSNLTVVKVLGVFPLFIVYLDELILSGLCYCECVVVCGLTCCLFFCWLIHAWNGCFVVISWSTFAMIDLLIRGWSVVIFWTVDQPLPWLIYWLLIYGWPLIIIVLLWSEYCYPLSVSSIDLSLISPTCYQLFYCPLLIYGCRSIIDLMMPMFNPLLSHLSVLPMLMQLMIQFFLPLLSVSSHCYQLMIHVHNLSLI